MDFLGVGPLELIFILIIALIIFGPNDIVRAGRTLGSFLRKVVTSDGWRAFQQASKGMRDLPNTLMREAGLEEEDLRELTGVKDIEEATRGLENQIAPWTTPPSLQPDTSTRFDEVLPPEELNHNKTEASSSGHGTDAMPKEPPAPPPGSPFSQTIDNDN
jgi:Sec-independent protein translocase protein TatA